MVTVKAVIEDLHGKGVSFTVEGDQLRALAPPGAVSAAVSRFIAEHKADVIQLVQRERDHENAWRVQAMRQQLPPPGKPFPVLVARPDIELQPGLCFSCGEPIQQSQFARCRLCAKAAWEAVFGIRENTK